MIETLCCRFRPSAGIFWLSIACLVSFVSASAATRIGLVQDGKPVASIVLPASPTEAEKTAAKELRDFVAAATGVQLRVVTEAGPGAPRRGSEIHIGRTEALLASGFLIAPLAAEEYLVQAKEGRIYIAGEDNSAVAAYGNPRFLAVGRAQGRGVPRDASLERAGGTHAALVHFIEESLGGGFLWPGSLGTVVPQGSTLIAHVQPIRYRPFIAQRLVRNQALNDRRYISHARAKGLSSAELLSHMEQSVRWMHSRGFGGRLKVSIGHSTTGWWDKYGKDEPTLFALQPTGVRGPVPASTMHQFDRGKTIKQCTTNPRVVDLVAEEMRAHFTKDPSSEFFPLAINDGRYHGFCMCEPCRALDEPSAESVDLYFVDADGKVQTYPYRFLTDRYAVFWRTCGELLAKLYPGKKIAVYAYGALEAPPTRQAIPDNMVVGFVGPEGMYLNESVRQNTLARWDGWVALKGHLIFRPNIHYPGFGLPIGFGRKLAADLKHFHRSGSLTGVDFDALHMSFGTQGHNHYVLARALWNPETPYDEIMQDFCSKAFGRASAPMGQYFEMLEEATTEVAAQPDSPQWLVRYIERLVGRDGAKVLDLFQQAAALVPEGSPERKRVEFFRDGYRYAEMVHEAVVATQRAARGEISAAARNKAVERLQAEFDRHSRNSWVVDRITIGDGIVRRPWADVLRGIRGEDTTLQREL